MRFGSRKSLFSPSGISFDPDAEAYFAAAGITDLNEKIAVNDFIVTAKSDGFWDLLERIYLVSPTSSTAALVCCRSLTSMTNVNSVAWSTNGFQPNYVDNYLDTNFSQADSIPINPLSVSIGMSIKDAEYLASSGAFAALGGSIETMNTRPMWCYTSDNTSTDTNFIGQGPSNLQTQISLLSGKTFSNMVTANVVITAIGPSFGCRSSLYIDEAESGFTNFSSGLIADNAQDIYFGAVNAGGGAFSSTPAPPTVPPTFNFMFIGTSINTVINQIYNAQVAYNTALGRA